MAQEKNPPAGGEKTTAIGAVKDREIVEEMRTSYLDYAMSVIVARALPDVRDGLKPVHRRILFAMQEEGLTHTAKFRKSATVVGAVLGRYHPHGDVAVYDSMVRMAQDFSMRYPLVEGQGNFGSIDNDPAAAMRYTEARMSRIGELILQDIEKDTVDFIDNYDGTRKEPIVLPSPLPQLLLNGTLGIAVGMATNIPPHNLTEVIDALLYLIDHPKADTEDLFQFVKGPDFPTGGIIFNKQEILQAYSQGKGPIVVRGRADVIEEDPSASAGRGKVPQIIISEIPYQVVKSSLLEQFAKLVQEKKIDGIKDIRDESDKDGMRIVFDLQRDAYPQKIINRLYKFSDLQKTFHLNLLALVDGIQPKVLSLADMLSLFVEHRRVVVTRRIKWELTKAKEREHILEGLWKALANIDKVIALIRKSEDREDAKVKLMKAFKLTEIQANAILDMRLSQLAKLERNKIEEELKAIRERIKELSAILASPKKIDEVVVKELQTMRETYKDERRTKVVVSAVGEIAEVDLIPQEDTIVTLTQGGYIKRINPETYKIQKRGGKGIVGMKTMGEDIVEHFLYGQTHDSMMVFTDSGKLFQTPVYEIPEGTRVSKGRGLLNFVDITPEDKVLTLFSMGKEDAVAGIKNLVMITKDGVIKKSALEDFKNVRRSGLIAITLKKGDLLRDVQKTTGEDELLIVTKLGQSIRFNEKDVRVMGRQAAGIHGIRLKKGDEVVGMDVIPSAKGQTPNIKVENYLFILSENGYGKKTDVKEYRLQSRGGSGIKTANVTPKTGNIVFARILNGAEEDLIVISRKGQVIRTPVTSIPKISRSTQGVRIMRLDQGDKVASAACM
ncbi:MAG: DNA gyrase subunit A [Candidatus Wildermuthbacteria bacterium]|nr:DNA gyrase subunit A [Candidatus Wildermuthbacteria bacterium]